MLLLENAQLITTEVSFLYSSGLENALRISCENAEVNELPLVRCSALKAESNCPK